MKHPYLPPVLFIPAILAHQAVMSAEFAGPVDISNGTANGITALDVADFNGDGLLDVAAACGGAHANGKLYAWFEQKADGTWQRHEFGNTDSFDDFVGSAKCADIDGDGDPDFVASIDGHSTGPIKLYIFENPGGDATGTWNHYAVATITGWHANDMQVADMDGDGRLDVVLRHKFPHDVKIIFQDEGPEWTVKAVGNKDGEGLSVGDLNADGRPDISLSGEWYKAPDSPRTGDYQKFTVTAYSNIATKEDIGDINGDGRPDILLSPAESFKNYGTAGEHDLAWFENPGNPEEVSEWTRHVILAGTNDLSFARLADFDGDGDLDVASGKDFSGENNYVKIHYNDQLDFSRTVTLATGKGIYSGAAADMDGDGDIDLVGEDNYAHASKPWFYENLTGPYSTRVADWLAGYGLTTEDFGLDTDGDGLPVGLEFALGLSPEVPDDRNPFRAHTEDGRLAVVFTRPSPPPSDVSYIGEASTTLATWYSDLSLSWPIEVIDNLDGTETAIIRLSSLISDLPAQFVRLRVVLN